MRFKSGATLDFKDHLQVVVLTLNNQQLSFLLAFSSSLPYSLSLLPFSPHLPSFPYSFFELWFWMSWSKRSWKLGRETSIEEWTCLIWPNSNRLSPSSEGPLVSDYPGFGENLRENLYQSQENPRKSLYLEVRVLEVGSPGWVCLRRENTVSHKSKYKFLLGR